MKAGLARFLWLWLPMLAVLLLGLRRAWLTGQADPWDWAMPAAVLMGLLGLLLARRGWAMLAWAAIGGGGAALIFCAIAAQQAANGMAALGLLAVALLATGGGAFMRQAPFASRLGAKEAGLAIVLLICAALLLWRGPAQPLTPAIDRPRLAVITALPLFWVEPGQDGPGPVDAPIVTVLRTRFDVRPLDDPAQLGESGARRLLLAQPRALTPAQMVAIDRWVRAGGRALVLADPLLRWPSALPLGDRRRAPATATIEPLLTHWGFRAAPLKEAEIRHFTPDGQLITVSGAAMVGADGGLIARKHVGRGEVLLVGDADLIDDRLWLADPARPLDPRLWVADTPALLVQWLGADLPGRRLWMRDVADVNAALRWALLVGTGWAILGAVLLRGRKRGGR